MKTKNSIVLLLSLAVVTACSSSKRMTYESRWNAPFSYVDEVKPDKQDARSRISYGIINDDKFLYITLKTKDPSTIDKILANGLRISFSPEGQRKDAYYLQFPVVMKEDRKALRRIDTDMPNSLGLKFLLDSYNKEALWKDRDGQHSINLVAGEGSIKSRISMDENNELTEQIIIPFNHMDLKIGDRPMLGINIKVEGQSSQSGISPRIGIGLGGGIGMGGGMGVGIGTGSGYNSQYGANDRPVDIRLDVQLAQVVN
ncbi:hypothetical protein DYBT9275_01889 [Dyadobacter sp. CECT 9275]|uniref:Lipoprotein n=1 Tax=Dyadobacter helix TaxID=2822344 RepID=A0A916JEJ8_9BACT|nr:hypothetical protein [Dyadobacter sp. CECT 9275]CAG4997950.1 hypothetical protein DYBT9275_01889 [Dyadobacter sp. CECT 9275]